LSATALTMLLGCSLGVLAASIGGVADTILSRFFDALLAFPGFLLILLAVAVLGGGTSQTVLAMGLAGSPLYFRLARSFARSELRSEYVTAARALGASNARQMLRHAVPNFAGSLAVQGASTAAAFLLVEASLSYLGLGVALPTPSWGNVLQDARSYLTRQPWAAVGPGLFLATASLSFQFISDGLRDVLDRRNCPRGSRDTLAQRAIIAWRRMAQAAWRSVHSGGRSGAGYVDLELGRPADQRRPGGEHRATRGLP